MKKGFTLIELLVVIAIIGILASIVLVSFPGATNKANDSRVVSGIRQIRTVMAYIWANENNYDKFECNSTCTCLNTDLTALCNEVRSKAADNTFDFGRNLATNSTSSCVYARLNVKANYWYCADSTGVAGFASTTPATNCKDASAGQYGSSVCPALSG